MTASNLSSDLTILGLDSFLDVAGVLVGLQHCVARSRHIHTIEKRATRRSGRSGKTVSQIIATTSARGERPHA